MMPPLEPDAGPPSRYVGPWYGSSGASRSAMRSGRSAPAADRLLGRTDAHGT